MNDNSKCYICGGNSHIQVEPLNGDSAFIQCDTCGRFRYNFANDISKDFLASFLYYNCKISSPIADKRYFCFLGSEAEFKETQKKYPFARLITKQEIEAWYPRTFSEKIDTILLGFSKLSKYDGSSFQMTYEQYCSALFVKRYNSNGSETTQEERNSQVAFIQSYLQENNFIKGGTSNFEGALITLLPNGFKRIDELQKNQSLNSKKVFVAMSFAESMKNAREAVRKAILDTGYIPRIMDEIEHNNQIVPEMLYEIKQSKFIVAEFTEHNKGVYYEAGYAAGLGKEVIHVCKEDSFNDGIHFDVKQINTIIWKTENELAEKLFNRIKATIE
ncbi:MAG: hypothetical protein LBU89_12390 [Fibromonadaceae bacterium]|jgi:nucleoside 2-deoxyribosyltransferase|nr:hypothetical protein [Fibromonadaceae bacterium]